MDTTTRNDSHGKVTAGWWVIGLWIRLALAGALVAFSGVAMLAERSTLDPSALGLVVVGAAVAAAAKRMAQRAIDQLDAAPGASEPQTLPATTPRRQGRRAWAVSP